VAAGFGGNNATQTRPEIGGQDKEANLEKLRPTKADQQVVKVFQQL
jgi:hypothetical protein